VLGTHGRSGQQLDIWQAVYTPVGEDGYPQTIWDKRTGEIDSEAARHFKKSTQPGTWLMHQEPGEIQP